MSIKRIFVLFQLLCYAVVDAFHINLASPSSSPILSSSSSFSRKIVGTTTGTSTSTTPTPTTTSSIIIRSRRTTTKQKKIMQLHATNTNTNSNNNYNIQNKDMVIIGGGLAGLSTALYMTQLDPSRHITIVDKESRGSTVASFAAAGMLAPQSERLPKGPLLDLCYASRTEYTDFVRLVEGLAANSGSEGQDYLNPDGENLREDDNHKIHYTSAGGFLAPAFAGDTVATWAPPSMNDDDDSEVGGGRALWLDSAQVHELEPNLHEDVIGGWWFPEDAHVDARRLTRSLRAAVIATGRVELKFGTDFEVKSLDLWNGRCNGIVTAGGKYMKAKSVVVANGSWMRQLLPVPIEPHKGQSLALRVDDVSASPLKRVLFAQDSYIVPKLHDNRIIIGATVEPGTFNEDVTPAGMMHMLHFAIQLVPALKDLPIDESWVGMRPTTPDKGPILGETQWSNVYLAGGYWRNGVLLAPKTGQLLAKLILSKETDTTDWLSEEDTMFLDAFRWDRFLSEDGGREMAFNARYAASFHPVQQRAEKGSGISAAVGTELGTYSTARSAASERARDREQMYASIDENDDEFAALERAAQQGIDDALAFENYETKNTKPTSSSSNDDEDTGVVNGATTTIDDEYDFGIKYEDPETKEVHDVPPSTTTPEEMVESIASKKKAEMQRVQEELEQQDKQVDDNEDDTSNTNLQDIYKTIQKNKEKVTVELNEEEKVDDRPDPGFRLHYVDPDTEEIHEVPPYTSPDEMVAMVREKNIKEGKVDPQTNANYQNNSMLTGGNAFSTGEVYTEDNDGDVENNDVDIVDASQQAFDGYSVIQNANGNENSREEELKAMKAARIQNRVLSDIKNNEIGVYNPDEL